MAQNKEQLDKLLSFISSLIKEPGNEDFTRKLQALVSPKSKTNASRFSQIERYLALDFKLDSVEPIIDYSFVTNNFIREMLVSDNREMLRYRFGVRGHKTDFYEFCRYASLQIEMLLFYYYDSTFDTLDAIKKDIVAHYPSANLEKYTTIGAIPLFAKILAYCDKFDSPKKDCLNNIRDIRNEQSHRGEQDEDEEFMREINKSLKMFPRYSTGAINFEKLEKDPIKMNLFKNMFQIQYNRYKKILWKRSQPFTEVIDAINDLALSIKANLQ